VTVLEAACALADVLDVDVEPELTATYRAGDIRHCFADTGLARDLLAFEPHVSLEAGLAELAEWLDGRVAIDRVEDATRELVARGLTS